MLRVHRAVAYETMREIVDRVGSYLPHGWRDFWLQFLVFWTFNLS